VIAAIFISFGLAVLSGYALFAGTAYRSSRAMDIIFGVSVAVFIVCVVTLISRKISALFGDDANTDGDNDSSGKTNS
jgi:uncharacterized membrane protein YccC